MAHSQLPQAGAEDVLYVVDISSYVFRAYFAVGHLSNSAGLATGAVLGVTRMLQKLLRDRSPKYVAIAMDSKTPTWRHEVFDQYKANRPPPPEDLVEQIPMVQKVVEAYQIAVLQRDGFEADDVIATAARKAHEAGLKTVIVTGDKDLMQLIGDDLIVWDTMKDKVWGADEVEAKWGVKPSALGDVLALMGDSSDNVPGVPSVGPKTATKLLVEHGDLESVLAAAPKKKGKLGQTLQDHAEQARLSKRLVTLTEEVDMDFSLKKLRFDGPDLPRLRELLEELEFTQVLEQLGPADLPAPAPADLPPRTYLPILTLEQLDQAVAAIGEAGEVSVDLETTSLDPVRAEIVGVALSWKPQEGWYLPVSHLYLGAPDQIGLVPALERLRPLLEDEAIRIYGQNFKYDDVVLRRNGVHTTNVAFDTMMASYLLDPGKRSHGLDQLAKDELGYEMTSYDQVTQKKRGSQLRFEEVEVEAATAYAAEDAEVVFTLVKRLEPKIEEAGFDKLMHQVELPLAGVLAEMELAGVLVDTKVLGELSHEVGQQLVELEARAQELAGHPFNLASPKQLATILFDEIGLAPVKKTKGRTARSTDMEVLGELAKEHELPKLVLEHRQLAKLKGTYLDGLPKLVTPETGRIHTTYNQSVAATGRLSSSEPNLQNIPIRTELGRRIRRAFVAPPGYKLLAADYSQVELRVLAHLSNDPLLIESFRSGEDVHERTAREIFGVPEGEEVPFEQRRRAKAINFGVIYGKSDYGLAKDLDISKTEARAFIESYFARYQGVKEFMDKTVAQAKEGQGVHTLMGRRRFLPELKSKNYAARSGAERMARNTPIQGTAADIMKVAMVRLSRRLAEESHLGARMILTVHDEVVLEVPLDQEAAVEAMVVEAMMGASDLMGEAELSVPLVVDPGWGLDWAEAH